MLSPEKPYHSHLLHLLAEIQWYTVTNVLVWNVEQSGTDDFTVAYEVDQQVKEGEQTQAVIENYTVTVHVDKGGAMVITQNPTLVLHKDDNWKIVE